MALTLLQVILAATPTQVIAAVTPVRQVIIESDDGNSNAAWVGDSAVATDTGILLTNSSTVPGRVVLGPFSGDAPFNLNEVYVIGTAAELVNILYVKA
jgi:hypothetical protein